MSADTVGVTNPHGSSHAPGGTDEMAYMRAAIRQQRRGELGGYYAETFERTAGNISGTVLATGSVYAMPIWLFAGQPVTKILTENLGPGSGITLIRFGICDSAGSSLAVGGDVKAIWTSNAEKSALVSYTPTVDGNYWLQMFFSGTTGPQPQRSGSSQFGGVLSGGSIGMAARMSGQVDIPSVMTFTYSSQCIQIWMGVG